MWIIGQDHQQHLQMHLIEKKNVSLFVTLLKFVRDKGPIDR